MKKIWLMKWPSSYTIALTCYLSLCPCYLLICLSLCFYY